MKSIPLNQPDGFLHQCAFTALSRFEQARALGTNHTDDCVRYLARAIAYSDCAKLPKAFTPLVMEMSEHFPAFDKVRRRLVEEAQ